MGARKQRVSPSDCQGQNKGRRTKVRKPLQQLHGLDHVILIRGLHDGQWHWRSHVPDGRCRRERIHGGQQQLSFEAICQVQQRLGGAVFASLLLVGPIEHSRHHSRLPGRSRRLFGQRIHRYGDAEGREDEERDEQHGFGHVTARDLGRRGRAQQLCNTGVLVLVLGHAGQAEVGELCTAGGIGCVRPACSST
eukprot:scaffold503_cov375-Pinguiococcus_pyrenoidosus.AAC.20